MSDGTDGYDLVTGLHSAPDGIAVCSNHSYIFWTNMGHPSAEGWTNTGSIQRCDLDGKNIVTVIEPGAKTHTPKQLVIAEKSKKLYWCDREGMRVMRSDFDGENVEMLVKNGDVEVAEHRADYLRWCVGIQVDEEAGYIYWSQKGPPKGGKGKILRCPIDGGGQNGEDIKVLFEHLPEPIDLCLDLPEGYLYWTDRGDIALGNTVNRARIPRNGQKVSHEVLVRKLHEGIGLDLDVRNRRMYMTDILGGVYSANLEGGDKKVLFSDLGTVTGIALAIFN